MTETITLALIASWAYHSYKAIKQNKKGDGCNHPRNSKRIKC